MKNKLHPNYKPNKIQMDILQKLSILNKIAQKGMLYIDEEKSILLIREELFHVTCTTPQRYKAFLTNVYYWMSYERSRKEVAQYTPTQLNSMSSLPVPPGKPFDFNVISKTGKYIVVGQFDGNNFKMVSYEETKEKIKETEIARQI